MVRMAVSAEVQLDTPKWSQTLTTFQVHTLKYVGHNKVRTELRRINSHQRSSKISLKEIISTYLSIDSFLRSPLPEEILPVPKPRLKLNAVEREIYEVLARKELYPEIVTLSRLIEELSGYRADKGLFVSLRERDEAQRLCFEESQLRAACVIQKTLKDDFNLILERVGLSEKESEDVSEQLFSLIIKSPSPSVMNYESFHSDAALFFLSQYDQIELIQVCLDYNKKFTHWDLINDSHCREAFEETLDREGVYSVGVRHAVMAQLFNPYSRFKKMMNSLSEDVLDRGILCFGEEDYSCKRKKLIDRLEDWPYSNLFFGKARQQLITSLAKNWIP